MTSLLVIILNYRTPDLTIGCLRSLETEVITVPGTEVIVVDNSSQDDSASRISGAIEQRGWSRWARLVVSPVNGGFAAGNNLGWKFGCNAGVPELLLLLNSDTVVNPGTFRHCVSIMRSNNLIGAMSCRLLNIDGSPQTNARGFPTPWRMLLCAAGLPWKFPSIFGGADCEQPSWDRNCVQRDVDWLGGAFLMLRADLIERIGLLDEDFFFYGEDIELCHRVWRAGKRCYYDPTCTITHYGGGSSDPERMSKQLRNHQIWRARYLVQRKCYGRLAEWLVRSADICACLARLVKLRMSRAANAELICDQRAVLNILCGRLMNAERRAV